MPREDLTFPSGDGHCAAWLWRPEGTAGDVPCVVMSHGFSLTRHDGLPAYAERLATAGLAVLAYDPRHFGDSPGTPRGQFRIGRQQADLEAAIARARGLDGIDPDRIVLWGFSFGAAHAVEVAARRPDGIAALVLLCPLADGLPRVLATPPALSAWIVPRALLDVLGRHTTIPVAAAPGGRGAMTRPGELDGFRRTVADGSPWHDRVTPGVFLGVGALRPVRRARRLPMPMWVGVGERDVTVDGRAARRLAQRAPRGELAVLDTDHFQPFERPWLDDIATRQREFVLAHTT